MIINLLIVIDRIFEPALEEPLGKRLVIDKRLESRAAAEHKFLSVFAGLNTFADNCKAEHFGEIDHIFNDDASSGIVQRELTEVELEIVCFKILKKIKGRSSETELVYSNLYAFFGKTPLFLEGIAP